MNPQKNEDRKYKITGRHVRIALHRDRKQRKQEQTDHFQMVYDKLKDVKFKTGEQLNMRKFFCMPKINTSFAFGGSKNAMAVFPVLASRADFETVKSFQLSRENISKLAGISTVSVDKGIQKLMEINFKLDDEITLPMLHREMEQDGQRRYWVYEIQFFRQGDEQGLNPERWRGGWFPFHSCIIDSGVWANLHSKEKALYLAMRSVGWFDRELYHAVESVYVPDFVEMYEDRVILPDIGQERYAQRKWDVTNKSLRELFELACIPYTNTKKHIEGLEKQGLIERMHDTKSVFKVWLRPKQFEKIRKSAP